MASTIQLSRTIAYASQCLYNRPLTFTNPTSNEPALSCADWTMQTILAPPFSWSWNRVGASPSAPLFTTAVGVSDYKVSVPTFGWIEKAVAYDPGSGFEAYELKNALNTGADTLPNQSTTIAAQYYDGSGDVIFRIFPAADKIYNVAVEYQKSAPLFTVVSQTWAPIPDYLSYLYDEGFFAKAAEYCNDPRAMSLFQMFFTNLAANAEGLNQTQRNLWLDSKMNTIRQTLATQQGRG